LTKPAKAEVSSERSPAQEDNAAKKALTAAEEAAVASKAAAAASAKALEASQHASKAAKEARSAAHTNAGTNSSNDANPDANGSGNQHAASPPRVHPPETPALITSSTKSGDEQARLRVERTIGKLQGAIAYMDSGKLNYDGKQRYALGTELLKGAQKAFSEHDYAAADSLATKASVLLAPLGLEVPGPAGRKTR
jgi:hypothetical protein